MFGMTVFMYILICADTLSHTQRLHSRTIHRLSLFQCISHTCRPSGNGRKNRFGLFSGCNGRVSLADRDASFVCGISPLPLLSLGQEVRSLRQGNSINLIKVYKQ